MSSMWPGATESACAGDEVARRHALQHRVDGGEQHGGPVAALEPREPRQRRHALRDERRHAATPGRRAGSPRPEIPAPRCRARRTRAHARAPPCAARRGRQPARLVAGASARAATARARSAMTSPSAPSATLASVSGRPRRSDAAGDFAIIASPPPRWKSRSRRNSAVSNSGGTSSSAGHPGEQIAVRHFHQPLELVEFAVAQSCRCAASAKRPMIRSISRMPRCQERNSSCAGAHPGLRSIGCCRSSVPRRNANAKNPDGPGAAYIARHARIVRVVCASRALRRRAEWPPPAIRGV